MFFLKYFGHRPVADIFLPGDKELYRPIIKRLQDKAYHMDRTRDFEDEYVRVLQLIKSTNSTSNHEEAD